MQRRVTTAQLQRLLPPAEPGDAAYAWLATGVRALISDGRLPLEARVPAERDLAQALGVSRTTTAAAYDLLRREGFLTSRRGAGTFTAFPAGGIPSWSARTVPPGTIDLSVAGPPAAREPFLAAAREAVEHLPRYLDTDGYDVLGLRELREAIAGEYCGRGVPTTADEIMVTSGAQAAIALIARVFAARGLRAVVESPTYPNALDAFRFVGARLVGVPVTEGWDVDAFAGALRQTGAGLAYLIPEFQNPTGLVMTEDERAAIAAAARGVGALVVADESFVGLQLDGRASGEPPLAAFDPGRVLSVGSLSKRIWGGLRVGWIRAAPSAIQRLAAERASVDLACSILDQLTAVRVLGDETILADQRRALRTRRDALAAALETTLPEWTFALPPGGLSLWIAIDRSNTALAAAAEAEGVRIVPGPRFGTDGALERYLRLPFVLPPAQLEEAVERLGRAASSTAAAAGGARRLDLVV
ncbi:MAG TPA: PLP-dependent aminotransferase family protein [Gaiellaceae bacterium]|nr:PLP-dependent aminotransferase family protein [Gaiellaceae bacterium]